MKRTAARYPIIIALIFGLEAAHAQWSLADTNHKSTSSYSGILYTNLLSITACDNAYAATYCFVSEGGSPQSVDAPVERLVVISFRDGTNWVTRRYDKQVLPSSMRIIHDIIWQDRASLPYFRPLF